MKQKNLAMLGVAVGCGLVAAIAVAKLSAGGSSGPETGKVLVAKKDVPIRTKLDAAAIDASFAWAEIPKNLIPQDAVLTIDELKGKLTNRTLKQGNPITATDVGTNNGIPIPSGMKQFAIKATAVDAVSGFVLPGDKVDIMYVERLGGAGKARSAIIMKNMLILTVNTVDQIQEGTGRAISEIQSVSLAVNDAKAKVLALAEVRGHLKLVRRDTQPEEGTQKPDEDVELEWTIDPFDAAGPSSDPAPAPTPKFDTAVVAKKPIPVNTLINADNVNDLFEVIKLEQAPAAAEKSLDDLKGKFVVRGVEPGQYLLKASLGKDRLPDPEPKKDAVAAKPPVEPKVEPKKVEAPKVEPRKFARYEQLIQEGGAARRVIWMEVDKNKWRRFDSEKDADDYKPGDEEKAPAPRPEKSGTGDV